MRKRNILLVEKIDLGGKQGKVKKFWINPEILFYPYTNGLRRREERKKLWKALTYSDKIGLDVLNFGGRILFYDEGVLDEAERRLWDDDYNFLLMREIPQPSPGFTIALLKTFERVFEGSEIFNIIWWVKESTLGKEGNYNYATILLLYSKIVGSLTYLPEEAFLRTDEIRNEEYEMIGTPSTFLFSLDKFIPQFRDSLYEIWDTLFKISNDDQKILFQRTIFPTIPESMYRTTYNDSISLMEELNVVKRVNEYYQEISNYSDFINRQYILLK